MTKAFSTLPPMGVPHKVPCQYKLKQIWVSLQGSEGLCPAGGYEAAKGGRPQPGAAPALQDAKHCGLHSSRPPFVPGSLLFRGLKVKRHPFPQLGAAVVRGCPCPLLRGGEHVGPLCELSLEAGFVCEVHLQG